MASASASRHEIMSIDNKMGGLWTNGKKFAIRRGSERDWSLYIYNDNSMMLVLHNPATSVDYFDSRPAKITYDDATQSILIARPVTSYQFKINKLSVYQSFKDLKLEEVYAE